MKHIKLLNEEFVVPNDLTILKTTINELIEDGSYTKEELKEIIIDILDNKDKKPLSELTEEDLFVCLRNEIPEGWQLAHYHIDDDWQGIRIRKQITNSNQYEYKTIFLKLGKIEHRECLRKKGYDV
jgi:hypothetical protein